MHEHDYATGTNTSSNGDSNSEKPNQAHFQPQLRFVFAGDKDSGKKVQEHIQKEYARKKRWKREVKQARDVKEAKRSFKEFVVRAKSGHNDETNTDRDGPRRGKGVDARVDGEATSKNITHIKAEEVEEIWRDDLNPRSSSEDMEMCTGPLVRSEMHEQKVAALMNLLGQGKTNPFGTWPLEQTGLDRMIDSCA
jgi:hypothetical protein